MIHNAPADGEKEDFEEDDYVYNMGNDDNDQEDDDNDLHKAFGGVTARQEPAGLCLGLALPPRGKGALSCTSAPQGLRDTQELQ